MFSVFLKIAAFEAIPTYWIYENMLERLEKETIQDELIEKLESLGFDSTWILPNLGSLIFFSVLFIATLFLLALLKCVAYFRPVNRYVSAIESFTFWNWPIKFLKESYSVISICCLINVFYASWETADAILNSVIAYIFLLMLILYPGLSALFLHSRKKDLKTKTFRKKFLAAYKGLIEKDGKYILFPLFFYYRRLLTPMIIILKPDNFIAQYLFMLLSGLAAMILIAYKPPFRSPSENRVEILSELGIQIALYHILCFTDWVPDLELRHKCGYSVIVFLLLYFFVFVSRSTISYLTRTIKATRRNKFINTSHEQASRKLEKAKKKIKAAILSRDTRGVKWLKKQAKEQEQDISAEVKSE